MASEWISVKDRMPENEKVVLISVCRKYYNDPSHYIRFVAKAFHTDGKHNTEDSSYVWEYWDFENTQYDEEHDAYLVPEGWWESVNYGEKFDEIDDEVTHWMSLPEPPEVNTK